MAKRSGMDSGVGGVQPFRAPEPTLRDYVRVISTRRWMVLSTFLVVMTLAGAWVFTRTPVYRSLARLEIAPGKTTATPFRGVLDDGTYLQPAKNDFLETQMRLILEDRPMEKTFNQFGIGNLPGYRGNRSALQQFAGLFDVNPVRRTWLVDVTFDWPNAKQGAVILDYHVNQYKRDFEMRRRELAMESAASLQKQREEYAPKVEKARSALQEFREKYNTVSFDEPHDTVAADLMARSKGVSDARQSLAETRVRIDQIEAAVRNKTPIENLPDVLKSQLIRDYRNEKVKCEQALSEGLKRFGEQHPEIRALRAKLDSIDENIASEIQRILASARTEFATAETLLAVRLDELEQQNRAVQEFNKLKLEYDRLKGDFDAMNENYLAVMKHIDQLEIVTGAQVKDETVTIERHPREETAPARPRKAMAMTLACLLGLALGIGLAFLFDNLDTTLKTKEDVARHLGLNLLGFVPEISEVSKGEGKHSMRELVMLGHPRSAVAEAFRSIRTALSFSVAAQDVRHIMVTSASPSEGKTLTCANIAAAIAQTGKRVLLVDGDMRKPALHKVLQMEQTPGLTNLLAGEGAATLADVVRPTDIPTLFFVAAGPTPPNPAELIGCERMKGLLEQMVSQYDRVVIDTPPVVNVTDAAVLCHAAHGVVFVVRSFRTPREVARRAVEILGSAGGKLLGAVLNNVDVPRGAYYYDSYYRYQHYYYYAEDGTRRKKRKSRDEERKRASA